jgi:outer membrane protein TolC
MRTSPPCPFGSRLAGVLVGLLGLGLGAPRVAEAKPLTLPELLDLAKRSNPGLAAGAQATAAIEAQLLEAKRSWYPTGELLALAAPAPEIRCAPSEQIVPRPADQSVEDWRENNCYRTNTPEATLNSLKGIFTRAEIRLVQPLYTFGKISAGVDAAQRGVAASRGREAGLAADLELNVKRAYFGLKLAREVVEMLSEGIGYLEQAEKVVEKNIAEGDGAPTDRFRLAVARTEADVRLLEAKRMVEVAKGGLRALVGPEAPADLDVDAEPLDAVEVPNRSAAEYQKVALESRPEVSALGNFAAAKRALADLESRRRLPDLVLMGTARYAYTSSVDNPKFAFADDPYNTYGAGVVAALRMSLDLGVKNARVAQARAQAAEATARQREALGGIAFEVRKAHAELDEAIKRRGTLEKGERAARSWVAAVKINFETGTAEAKDFSDALLAWFGLRGRALQAIFDVNMAAAALTRATGAEVASAPAAPAAPAATTKD